MHTDLCVNTQKRTVYLPSQAHIQTGWTPSDLDKEKKIKTIKTTACSGTIAWKIPIKRAAGGWNRLVWSALRCLNMKTATIPAIGSTHTEADQWSVRAWKAHIDFLQTTDSAEESRHQQLINANCTWKVGTCTEEWEAKQTWNVQIQPTEKEGSTLSWELKIEAEGSAKDCALWIIS